MKRVEGYKLRNGSIQMSLTQAKALAKDVYDQSLTDLAQRLNNIDNFVDMKNFVDHNLDDFVELNELKKDIELENSNGK